MNIIIHNKTQSIAEPCSVQALVESLKLNPRNIAIERNLAIVPRSLYTQTWLAEGDRIEIVQFIGGG